MMGNPIFDLLSKTITWQVTKNVPIRVFIKFEIILASDWLKQL
jgi:hypothetical protein